MADFTVKALEADLDFGRLSHPWRRATDAD